MTRFQEFLASGGTNDKLYCGRVTQFLAPQPGNIKRDMSLAGIKARAWCEAILLDWLIPTDTSDDLEPHARESYELEAK